MKQHAQSTCRDNAKKKTYHNQQQIIGPSPLVTAVHESRKARPTRAVQGHLFQDLLQDLECVRYHACVCECVHARLVSWPRSSVRLLLSAMESTTGLFSHLAATVPINIARITPNNFSHIVRLCLVSFEVSPDPITQFATVLFIRHFSNCLQHAAIQTQHLRAPNKLRQMNKKEDSKRQGHRHMHSRHGMISYMSQ